MLLLTVVLTSNIWAGSKVDLCIESSSSVNKIQKQVDGYEVKLIIGKELIEKERKILSDISFKLRNHKFDKRNDYMWLENKYSKQKELIYDFETYQLNNKNVFNDLKNQKQVFVDETLMYCDAVKNKKIIFDACMDNKLLSAPFCHNFFEAEKPESIVQALYFLDGRWELSSGERVEVDFSKAYLLEEEKKVYFKEKLKYKNIQLVENNIWEGEEKVHNRKTNKDYWKRIRIVKNGINTVNIYSYADGMHYVLKRINEK